MTVSLDSKVYTIMYYYIITASYLCVYIFYSTYFYKSFNLTNRL